MRELYTTAFTESEVSADTAILWGFTLASLLVFGFMSLKPHVWVSISPFKTRDRNRLVAIYRWLGAIVVAGVLINVILMLTLWKG